MPLNRFIVGGVNEAVSGSARRVQAQEEDPSRPLSERGWEDIRKVAKYAEKCLHVQVDQIVHSGKLRARQTAGVLGEHLHSTRR
jgi:phosphohistidine phosphatase